jgi:hypothetical protein
MKFDKTMQVTDELKTSDGMGGYTSERTVIGEIQVFITPVKAEIMLREYGIVSTSSMKVFTKDTIPHELVQLYLDDKQYKILQLSDFNKLRMLLVEVI